MNKPALERIFFFGEAGQVNPATSAVGLTRMLYSYKHVAEFLAARLESDQLDELALSPPSDLYMSNFNRLFQEEFFRLVLNFSSDGFKKLVACMAEQQSSEVFDLVFADFTPAFGSLKDMLLRASARKHNPMIKAMILAAVRLMKSTPMGRFFKSQQAHLPDL